MELKSSGEVWEKLESQYVSISLTNKLYMKQKLYGLKMVERCKYFSEGLCFDSNTRGVSFLVSIELLFVNDNSCKW